MILLKAKGVKGSEPGFDPAYARACAERRWGAAQGVCSRVGFVDKDLIHRTSHCPAGRGRTQRVAGYQGSVQDQILAQSNSVNPRSCMLASRIFAVKVLLFPLLLGSCNIISVLLLSGGKKIFRTIFGMHISFILHKIMPLYFLEDVDGQFNLGYGKPSCPYVIIKSAVSVNQFMMGR